MKRLILILIVAVAGGMSVGCADIKPSPNTDLHETFDAFADGVTVDGIDISGLDMDAAREKVNGAKSRLVKSVDVTVTVAGERFIVNASELGMSFNTDDVLRTAASVKNGLSNNSGAKAFETLPAVDEKRVRQAAENAAAALDKAPENAEVELGTNGEMFLYVQDIDGVKIDVESLEKEIETMALSLESGEIEGKYAVLKADYSMADAKEDTQLIAEFSTYFKGATLSVENRVFNIKKAADLIDGTVIDAGEEFSMNERLGPRNGEKGWKTAAGIKDGAYVQEYGGGVCQVSTTLYNAVLMADLEVTDRSHHSWPLAYIDIGRDATISTGGPDFKFKNTSGARLFIAAFADEAEKSVTVRLYGRPPDDGVTIRVRSQKIKTLEEPGTRIEVREDIDPGKEKVIRKARTGAVSETYKDYYSADGMLYKTELVSRDKYRSIEGIVAVGENETESDETYLEITEYENGGA